MSTNHDSSQPPRHDPLGALRVPAFRAFVAGRALTSTALALLQVSIAWQVYQLTHSAFSLGALGLVRFVPALFLSLLAGAVADRYDRRRIVLIGEAGLLLCAAGLVFVARAGDARLALIYGAVLLIALASAFEEPAGDSLLPLLVPREQFGNAVALYSALQEIGYLGGPALAGVLIATAGVGAAYMVQAALFLVALGALLLVHPRQERGEPREVSLAAIAEGLRFVWRNQVLLGAMTLDLFAVVFAGATALLPIYAESILKVGATGYGLLASSISAGAIVTSVVLAVAPPIVRAGRALLCAVAAFGLATIVFGFSRSFVLSLGAYAAVGAADQVSVILRHTMIQLATPDELRGRVSSVSSLFVGASNQLGLAESGIIAAVTSATFAVVSGGAGCLIVVAAVAGRLPGLRRYTVTPAEHTREVELS
ncbi:MAG: MFS transporter [Dehalococcoidia bacterium]